MYKCECCEYSTTIKCNFNKHLNTQKHIHKNNKLTTHNVKSLGEDSFRVCFLDDRNSFRINRQHCCENFARRHNLLCNTSSSIHVCRKGNAFVDQTGMNTKSNRFEH